MVTLKRSPKNLELDIIVAKKRNSNTVSVASSKLHGKRRIPWRGMKICVPQNTVQGCMTARRPMLTSMPSCLTTKFDTYWTSTHHCRLVVVVVVSMTYDISPMTPNAPSKFAVDLNVSTVVLALKPIDELTDLPA